MNISFMSVNLGFTRLKSERWLSKHGGLVVDRKEKLTLLALTLPLVLFSGGYAYAAIMSSSYVVVVSGTVSPGSTSSPTALTLQADCNTGDYVTGGGWNSGNDPPTHPISMPTKGDATIFTNGVTPDGWQVAFENTNGISYGVSAYAVCQTPITSAGLTVPEFGSLYVAIALGALVYFGLSVLRSRSKAPITG